MSYYSYCDWGPSNDNSSNVYAWCKMCERQGHILTECPIFIAHKRAQRSYQGHQVQGWNPYSQTYDQGWSSHPNFSWSDPNSYGGGETQFSAPPPPYQPYQESYYPWPQQDQFHQYDYTQVLDGPNPPMYEPPPRMDQITQEDNL